MNASEARAKFDEADALADHIMRLYEQGRASRLQLDLANSQAAEAWDIYLRAKNADLPAFVESVR